MIRAMTFAAASLLIVSTAVAQQASEAPAQPAKEVASVVPAAAAPAAKPKRAEKIVCEHEEVIGSRLEGRRICKTVSQWAAERADTRAQIDHSQTNRNAGWGP